MSHKMLRPFIVTVYVLGYFPLHLEAYIIIRFRFYTRVIIEAELIIDIS